MCFGGPGPGGSAAAAASGTPASAIGPSATPTVGGSIPGGIGLGIGGGGMAASTGLGVPGAGQGGGGIGDYGGGWEPASLAPGNEPQPSGWGSSDWGQAISLGMTALGMFVPGLQPLAAASIVPEFFGMLPDMNISRPIPEESAETIINQSGSTGQPASLPSVSTPTPVPEPVASEQPAIDNVAFNKDLMDQYMSTILSAPSGGGRGIRGAGRPGYKAQQKQTADDWLAKYWRE